MKKNYIIICLAIVVVVMIVGLGILINRRRSTGLVNDNVVVMKNNSSINVEKVNTGDVLSSDRPIQRIHQTIANMF